MKMGLEEFLELNVEEIIAVNGGSSWACDMDIGSYKNLVGVVVDYSISGKGNTKTGKAAFVSLN